MTEIRALTVRQPWAWAIIHGGKNVENRTWNVAGGYRGPVLIHAGLREDLDSACRSDALRSAYRHVREKGHPAAYVAKRCGEKSTHRNIVSERYGNLGGIIGVVDLVDVHNALHICCSSHARAGGPEIMCSPWASPPYRDGFDDWQGDYHLVLTNPRPLPEPIPYKGRPGLWRIDTDQVPGLEGLL